MEKGATVLVVDDGIKITDTVSRILSSEKINALAANSGLETLGIMKGKPVDIAKAEILDVLCYEKNGTRAICKLVKRCDKN